MASNPNPISSWLGRSSQRVAATAAGLLVAVGLAVGIIIATTGNADASLLESVSALGNQTDIALADGTLSESEAVELQRAIDEIVARIESGDDLAELSTGELEIVLGALGRIRGDLVVAAGGESVAAVETLSGNIEQVSARVRRARGTRSAGELVVALPSSASETAVSQIFEIEELPVTVVAGEAGSVEISAVDGSLLVSRTNGADGWSVAIRTPSGQTVSVSFSDGGVTVQVDATITEDGDVAITTTADDGDDSDATSAAAADPVTESFTVGSAGIVVLEYTGETITLVSTDINEGWELIVDDDDDDDADELRVEFRSADRGVRFDAELEDGALEIEIREFDLEEDTEGDGDENEANAEVDADEDGDGVQRFEINGDLTKTFDFDAGSVTIAVTETSVEELTSEANEGWSVENERIAGRSGRVDFENEDGDKVQFKAEVAGGNLQVKIDLIEKGDDDEDEADEEEAIEPGETRTDDFAVEAAGVVQITHNNVEISDVNVIAAAGWTTEVDQDDVKVKVRFSDGDTEIEFEAELEDGELVTEIKVEDDDGDDDGEDESRVDKLEIDGELTETFTSEAGTVTIRVSETSIDELTFEAADGWTVEDDSRISGREARILFENEDGDKVQFKAEVAGGRLLVKFDDATGDDDDDDDEDKDDDDDKDDDEKDGNRGNGNGGNGRPNGDNDDDDDEEDD